MRVGKTGEPGIAAAVVDLAMDKQWSGARAWREHMALTQNEVAHRMGITQGAYAQLEAYDAAQQSSLAALKADIDLGIADVKAGRVSKMDMAAIKSQARAAKKAPDAPGIFCAQRPDRSLRGMVVHCRSRH